VTNLVLLTLRFRAKNICWPKASGGCHVIGKEFFELIPDTIMPRYNSFNYSKIHLLKQGVFNMGRSKLLASIVVGATVGAALSMFDRVTREKTIASTKKMKEAISYYSANREELQVLVEEKVLAAKVLCENVSENVNSIIDKVDEFKELPYTIEGMIKDTKSAFSLPDKE